MYLNFIILPLITFFTIGTMGRYMGNKGVLNMILINMTILILMVLLMFYENFLDSNTVTIDFWNSMKTDLLNVNMYIYIDELAQMMLLVILSISFVVLVYTYDYMIADAHIIRFYSYIILFVFFMILLITTNSMPILFIGWEGVGLVSFLLITFWYTRFNAQLGGLIALLMNRVGDIFYLIGLFLSLVWLGSYDLISISANYNINWDYILIPLFIAAITKSAQIYLHLWLPYSMEGPTPISALIHAATMVTAGVFLLLRLNQLILSSYYTLVLILIIGGLTAFIGGTLAVISLDMKELIAYSTMSQLGYMVTILGLKANNLSFYHLVFHAYFKALLFLTAGAIIHTVLDFQDFRKMGGLLKLLPVQGILSFIGLFSLIGFPFTTGFYSKENILNNSYVGFSSLLYHYAYLILLVSALVTIYYSLNFYKYIFLGEPKLSLFNLKHIHFFSLHLLYPISILALFTIIIGFTFSKWIHLFNINIISYSFNVPLIIKSIPLIFMGIIFILVNTLILNKSFNIFILFKQYSFKYLYKFISGFFFAISYRIFFKLFDYGFLDLLGPISGRYISHISNGILNINYISLFIFLIVIFLI